MVITFDLDHALPGGVREGGPLRVGSKDAIAAPVEQSLPASIVQRLLVFAGIHSELSYPSYKNNKTVKSKLRLTIPTLIQDVQYMAQVAGENQLLYCDLMRRDRESSMNWHKVVPFTHSLRCYFTLSKCNARPCLAKGHVLFICQLY
jgi:hypothetical protein